MTQTHQVHPSSVPEVEEPLDLMVREHAATARKLQSAAMADFATGKWNVIGRITGWLARRQQEIHTREALETCSDHTLADIGILRDDIPLVAKGIDPATVPPGRLPRVRMALKAMGLLQTAQQRRVERELSAYTDRELNEIGINRGDIPRIARTA